MMFNNKLAACGLTVGWSLLFACVPLAGSDDPDAGEQCQAAGEVCGAGGDECCAELFCPAFVYGDATCQAQRANGEPCDGDASCLDGACIDGVCGGVNADDDGDGGEGSSEGGDSGGGSGEDPACLGVSEECQGGGCCEGLFCPPDFGYVPPACEPLREDGAYCVAAGDCVSAVCIDNVCGEPCLALGADCVQGGASCCDGYCNVFDYGPTTCVALAKPGAFCQENLQCASGQCTEFVCE